MTPVTSFLQLTRDVMDPPTFAVAESEGTKKHVDDSERGGVKQLA